MTPQRLAGFFRSREQAAAPMVLATVVATGGSTYSKASDFMLIDAEGGFCGMLSGGCLEGDLVERAQQVLANNAAQLAEYDLNPDDELWGLGVGCDGTLRIYLQPILAQDHYEPYRSIAAASRGSQAVEVYLSPEYRVRVEPYPALLVLGAGPDVEPILTTALQLGWRCTVNDHRRAYIERLPNTEEIQLHNWAATEIAEHLSLDQFDLVLVMSHHLQSDTDYLRQLADSPAAYIGLLGPIARRDRILADIGTRAESLSGRLRAPVGLDLGGRGAAAIAVSIIAEMQLYMSTRSRETGRPQDGRLL